jgi:putative spermidine/putrescine transport system substrate-binding protein
MPESPPTAALSRRQLLALGAGCGAALLAGCRGSSGPRLLAAAGELPPAWLQKLPSPWQLQQLPGPAEVVATLSPPTSDGSGGDRQRGDAAALVALADGWASGEPRQRWQPLDQPAPRAALARLAPFAAAASRLFGSAGERLEDQPALAFPWAYSPWVIALRSRADLARQPERGWDLLLDPSLRGRLVLPASARVCIEVMGGTFERVRQLRRQALAHNDRHGLNLLLSGAADAAVVPLRPLVPLLRRDPRLRVLWPSSGAPLAWQLLLRPAQLGAAQAGPAGPVAAWPDGWLDQLLQPPLLPALLAGGWVPPLPLQQLAPLVSRFPAPLRPLLAPDPALLARCWSLPPLDPRERLALQTLWDAAAP